MTTQPSRDVEARLADLLVRVIDWLKFAEAKNTAAVGLSTTALGVIVTFLVAGPPVPDLAGIGLSVGAVLLMVSLLLAVASFLPSTNLEKHLLGARAEPAATDNLPLLRPHRAIRAARPGPRHRHPLLRAHR